MRQSKTMVPRLKTQSSTASSGGESNRSCGTIEKKKRKKYRNTSKENNNNNNNNNKNNSNRNHILSKFGYSPQRKKTDKSLIRKSPSRPQQSLYDSSLNISENYDGESGVVNPYRMLQIRRDATQCEIKQAYRRLALWHHPRRQSTLSKKERERRLRIFVVLAACCETLLERESRTRLDSLLRGRALRRPMPATNIAAAAATPPPPPPPKWLGQKQRPRPAEFPSSSSGDLPILYLSNSCSSSSDFSSTQSGGEVDVVVESWFDWACAGGKETPKASANSSRSKLVDRRSTQHHSLMSCSTEEADRIHYTQKETNRLFGGPLSIMYRARSFRAFSDPYVIFDRIFGSEVFPSTTADDTSCSTPPKQSTAAALTMNTPGSSSPSRAPPTTAALPGGTFRSSAWSGSIESRPDGTTIYTTVRILNGRRLIKRETISIDPRTGQKRSIITVTGEDLYPNDADDDDDTDDSLGKHSKLRKDDAAAEIGYWACCGPMLLFTTTSRNNMQDDDDDDSSSISGGGAKHNSNTTTTTNSHNCSNMPMAIFYRMNCVVW